MIVKRAPALLPLLLLMLPISCSKNAASAGPSSASTATPSEAPPGGATSSTQTQGMHGPGTDPPHLLLSTAYELPLSSTQKTTVDTLRAQLDSNDAETGRAFKTLQTDLVSGIRAGAIDSAKMSSDEAAIDRAMQAHMAKEADVLNRLHATLDPSQRATVVSSVRAKTTAYGGGPSGGQMGGGQMGPGGATGAAEWNRRRLDRLTTELGLDATQQKQVAALLAQNETPSAMDATHRNEHQNRMDALLTAFQQDSFDAKSLNTPMQGKTPREFMHRHVEFISQLVPILRPDQREKLAASLDRGFMGHAPQGGGMDDGSGTAP